MSSQKSETVEAGTRADTPFIVRNVLHPAMAGLLPYFFFLAAGSIVADLTPLVPYGPLFHIVLPLSILAELIIGNIMSRERAGAGARLRELVFLLVIVYAITSLVQDGTMEQRFSPSIHNLYVTIAAGLAWVSTLNIHSSLRQREQFVAQVSQKDGDQLTKYIRDTLGFSEQVSRELKRIASSGAFSLLPLFLAFVGSWSLGETLGVRSYVLSVTYAALYYATLLILNAFQDELEMYGEGLSINAAQQVGRVVMGVSIIGIAALTAFLFARSQSVFSLAIFIEPMEWFLGLFMDSDRAAEVVSDAMNNTGTVGPSEPSVPMAPSEPSSAFTLLGKILQWTIVSAIGVALLAALILPLFTRDFLNTIKRFRPLAAIGRFFRIIGRFFASLFSGKGKSRSMGGDELDPDTADPFDINKQRRDIKVDPRKRQELDVFAREFTRIFKWAAARDVTLRRGQAPMEFAAELSAAVPGVREDITIATELLEEELYSDHILGKNRVKIFQDCAKNVYSYIEPRESS